MSTGNINQHQVASDWARITLKRFQKKIDQLKIGSSGGLKRSLEEAATIIMNSDGNVKNIQMQFLYYGRFVDMGVGKGVSLGDQQEDNRLRNRADAFRNSRKAKKWYSKTLAAEVHTLAKIMAEKFGVSGIGYTENDLNVTIDPV